MGQCSKLPPSYSDLPDASSPNLHRSHPTHKENEAIWKSTSDSWKDALTVSQYLEESAYLMTVPLAKNHRMTRWVLVDKNLPPDQRPLLASCETFRKQSLVSDSERNLSETITRGIASVYCDPVYRGRGYASASLGCLQWYGKGNENEIDWLHNEKYAWC